MVSLSSQCSNLGLSRSKTNILITTLTIFPSHELCKAWKSTWECFVVSLETGLSTCSFREWWREIERGGPFSVTNECSIHQLTIRVQNLIPSVISRNLCQWYSRKRNLCQWAWSWSVPCLTRVISTIGCRGYSYLFFSTFLTLPCIQQFSTNHCSCCWAINFSVEKGASVKMR